LNKKVISLNSLLPGSTRDKCTPPGNTGRGGAETLAKPPAQLMGPAVKHGQGAERSRSPGAGRAPVSPRRAWQQQAGARGATGTLVRSASGRLERSERAESPPK